MPIQKLLVTALHFEIAIKFNKMNRGIKCGTRPVMIHIFGSIKTSKSLTIKILYLIEITEGMMREPSCSIRKKNKNGY